MPRATWKGSISFGLVHFPVELFGAVRKQKVGFHQLHDADGVRIRQARICPADGEEVPYENIVKGYEIAPDRYVIVTPDELDAIEAESSHTIELEKFVDASEIDPLFYDSSYYVIPDKAAVKPYELLRDAMSEENRTAVARIVMRTKEYVATLRAHQDVIVLSTLNYADEIVGAKRLMPEVEVPAGRKEELAAARQLVSALSSQFDLSDYKDEYRARVMELIEAKAEGKEIATQPATAPPTTPVPDLMAALEQSIAAAASVTGGAKKKPARKRAAKSSSNGSAPARAKTGSGTSKRRGS